jgi:hypothetical protein
MCLIKGRLEIKIIPLPIQTKRNFYRFIYSDTATIITGTKEIGLLETND